jgi:hypothetical protein
MMAAVRVDAARAVEASPGQRPLAVDDADPERRRRLPDRRSAVYCVKHAVAQILRVALPRSPSHRASRVAT